jgi:preprotein translocase subunit SecD
MSVRLKFILVVILAVVAGILAYPKEDSLLHAIGLKHSHMGVKEGLDLQGGAQLVYQADLGKTPQADRSTALDSLKKVMETRANFGGTGEVNVQQQGGNRLSIELPGVKDVNEAINRIGKTAQLSIYEISPSSQVPIDSGLSGKDIQEANPDIDVQTGRPIITFQMKGGKSTSAFSDLTTRIYQEQGQLLITLDNQTLFNGPVQNPITNGSGQMTGFNSVQDSKSIAQLINAGALPVPVTLVQQRTVGPTLGAESVSRSFVAGLIGLIIVALFMLSYYRLAGLVAVGALGIYTALTLTIYKLTAFIPGFTIVLTLGGIAGFIISIGMAVDANILIFERLKEEVRAGKSFTTALELAFQRAWTSIRDSNVSTLITCAILYKFGNQPSIRGFAVTLGLGVLISLFSAVVISRTLMRFVARYSWGRQASWYGIQLPKSEEATV